jgi:hypothetical protein
VTVIADLTLLPFALALDVVITAERIFGRGGRRCWYRDGWNNLSFWYVPAAAETACSAVGARNGRRADP